MTVDETVIATKSYVDATAQGLSIIGSVRYASTGNFTIGLNASGGLDGVSPANGDRVLLKNQDDATENGIYIYSSGSQTLVPSTNVEDLDLKKGTFVFIEEGGQAAQGWIITAYTAGASTWTQFSAAGEYTAGDGIQFTNGAISVKLDTNSGLSEGTNGLKVDLATNSGLATSGGLHVKAGTGISVSGDTTSIDTATVVRKTTATIGDGAATAYTINHNFNSIVEVSVYDSSTYEQVETDVTIQDLNNVVIGFAVAPATGAYKVVIQG